MPCRRHAAVSTKILWLLAALALGLQMMIIVTNDEGEWVTVPKTLGPSDIIAGGGTGENMGADQVPDTDGVALRDARHDAVQKHYNSLADMVQSGDPIEDEKAPPVGPKLHNKKVEKTKGPLVFDRLAGWNGNTHEEGIAFCKSEADSRSICPWRGYCPQGHLFSGIQQSNNETELWAPISLEGQGQPVWVNVGSKYPCMQRGSLGEAERIKMKYIMCCHKGEEDHEDVLPDLTTVNQTDLLIDIRSCRKSCRSNNNGISIIPSPTQRHCLARCRWIYRQQAISRLTNLSKMQGYDSSMTILPPLMEGRCRDISDKLRYDGVCTSVAHRQKPRIELVLSSKSWLANEIDLGLRDCAASSCDVSRGPGHSKSSHLFLGTAQPAAHPSKVKKMTVSQINVIIQPESLNNTNGGKPIKPDKGKVDWLASHRQDGFDRKSWIPYSNINADGDYFRITGKSHSERRVPVPVFIRNCNPNSVHSDRAHLIAELGKHVKIEQFGRCELVGAKKTRLEDAYPQCGSLPRRSAMWDAQKECVFFHSMFALVTENTFEENYITEKLYQPLKMGTVPIVLGNSSLYRRYLPDPNGAVYLDDFTTFDAAAKYLHSMMNDSNLWQKHLAWKERAFSDDFSFLASHSFATLPCDLCDKYAEEVLSDSERSWDRSLDLEILDPCVVDILSRNTIPDNLPLVNPSFGFDAVFVTHYTKLSARKQVMIDRVRQVLGVDPIFITDFDRENLTKEDMKCFGDSEAQLAYIQRVSKEGEVSLTMKHFAIYFYMVQLSLDNVLILEDDASFSHLDWTSKRSDWQQIIQGLPASYDLLLLSAFGNIRKRGEKITEHLYLAQQSRTASMYLISQKGARNMLRSLPMVSVIDFQMNYAAHHQGNKWMEKMPGFHGPRTVGIEIYHSEPPMSVQIEPDGHKATWRND